MKHESDQFSLTALRVLAPFHPSHSEKLNISKEKMSKEKLTPWSVKSESSQEHFPRVLSDFLVCFVALNVKSLAFVCLTQPTCSERPARLREPVDFCFCRVDGENSDELN